MNEFHVTVAIPSRGNRTSLIEAVDSVLKNTGVATKEVVVVWSGRPTPPTWADCLPTTVRQLFEPNGGASRARNLALDQARSPIVAFTEDDAFCPPSWLFSLINGFNDGAAITGGPVQVVWPRGTPRWVTPNVNALFGFTGGEERRPLKPGETLVGNMAVDRKIVQDLGGFNVGLGHGAGTALMGEETDLCNRASEAGHTILYEPSAEIEHRIERKAATRRNYLRRMFKLGRTLSVLDGRPSGQPLKQIAKTLALIASAAAPTRTTDRLAEASFLLGQLWSTPLLEAASPWQKAPR